MGDSDRLVDDYEHLTLAEERKAQQRRDDGLLADE